MTLSELTNGQTVRYRVGKAGDTRHEYGEWKDGELYLVRREKDLPKKYHRQAYGDEWKAGAIINLCVPDWPAEYSQRDYCGAGIFMAEEWCLEIEGLI